MEVECNPMIFLTQLESKTNIRRNNWHHTCTLHRIFHLSLDVFSKRKQLIVRRGTLLSSYVYHNRPHHKSKMFFLFRAALGDLEEEDHAAAGAIRFEIVTDILPLFYLPLESCFIV